MKNVMKKVFSLLLVGVVAVSMFGFIAPTRAEAVCDKGTLVLYNTHDNVFTFYVSFTDYDGNVTELPPYTLTRDYMRFVYIPRETKFVDIGVDDGVLEFNTRLKALFEGSSDNEIFVSSYDINYEETCWLKVAN